MWHPVGKPNGVNLQNAPWDPELLTPAHLPARRVAADFVHSPPISSYSVPCSETFALHLWKHPDIGGWGEHKCAEFQTASMGETPWQPVHMFFFAPRENAQIWLERLKSLASTLVSNVLSTVFSGGEVCVSQTSRQRKGRSQEARKCDSDRCEL